jgi:hypothetical protein
VNEWFSPETAKYFSFLSLLSLMAMMSYWVRQGRHRSLVIGSFIVSIVFGGVLLAGAAVAWSLEQPAWVVRPMALSGFVVTIVFAATLGTIRRGYEESEQRRIVAKDI